MYFQELLTQFDDFKQSLDKLRTKGGDIIRHSWDQTEKQDVQKTIADVNRQWLSLQVTIIIINHQSSLISLSYSLCVRPNIYNKDYIIYYLLMLIVIIW